jgi:hypothetical protein
MPKPKTTNNARSVRRIAIDGHFLDEIQTRLQTPASSKSLTYPAAPVERHQVIEDEEGITLKLPVLTALQLYHDGILSADPQKSVQLTIATRKLGAPTAAPSDYLLVKASTTDLPSCTCTAADTKYPAPAPMRAQTGQFPLGSVLSKGSFPTYV